MDRKIDLVAYCRLEDEFRKQVTRDNCNAAKKITEDPAIYFPIKEPKHRVDYIFVGMEPARSWAKNYQEAKEKIEGGARNFEMLDADNTKPLPLFRRAIESYLCLNSETYILTDLAKGAMPTALAEIDRQQRYRDWYELLLEELAIVGKPDAPVIAIGGAVKRFLTENGLEDKTHRRLYDVLHYSGNASPHWPKEARKDPQGYQEFCREAFAPGSFWGSGLTEAKRGLVFNYKVQLERIRAKEDEA